MNLKYNSFNCMHFCVQTDPNYYGIVPETPPGAGAHRRVLATPASPVAGGSGSGSGSGSSSGSSSSSHEDAVPYAPPATPTPPRAARRIRFRSAPQAFVAPPAAPVPAQRRHRRTQRQMLRAARRDLQQASRYWRAPPRRRRNSARGYDNL